jgi:hypothetical protein
MPYGRMGEPRAALNHRVSENAFDQHLLFTANPIASGGRAMKRFILLFACTLLLAGCAKRVGWNQKMTLYIDTPSGAIVASGVVAVKRVDAVWFKSFNYQENKLTGEAVVVDMGEGRMLFALLGGVNSLLHNTLWDAGLIDSKGFKDVKRAIKTRTEPVTVPPKLYPLFVTFDDVSEPKSVRLVDPADLAATFGAGYSLREITLQITREPVTSGVVEGVFDYFTWPDEKRREYRCAAGDCSTYPMRIPYKNGTTDILNKNDFIRGGK